MSNLDAEVAPLAQFADNIAYARGMAETAGHLNAEREADLYRAAWIQAVAALDYWVHRELYQRATAIALDTSASRSRRFLNFAIPWKKVEEIHHGERQLREVFLEALQEKYAHQSFQSTQHIGEALSLVLGDSTTTNTMWQRTAQKLGMDKAAMVQRHDGEVIQRRNQISHTSDIDPSTHTRRPIAKVETNEAIEWVERMVDALSRTLPSFSL